MVTDGLVESTNDDDFEFGLDSLTTILADHPVSATFLGAHDHDDELGDEADPAWAADTAMGTSSVITMISDSKSIPYSSLTTSASTAPSR